MDKFEKEIIYFSNLISNNIKNAQIYNKQYQKNLVDICSFNIHISLDGQKVVVYNQEKEEVYKILKKDIENFTFENDITKDLAFRYIENLTKYAKGITSFEYYTEHQRKDLSIFAILFSRRDGIIGQIRMFHWHRNIPEVQEYIDMVYNGGCKNKYVNYLIDKYYYNKKGLVKPKYDSIISWCAPQMGLF